MQNRPLDLDSELTCECRLSPSAKLSFIVFYREVCKICDKFGLREILGMKVGKKKLAADVQLKHDLFEYVLSSFFFRPKDINADVFASGFFDDFFASLKNASFSDPMQVEMVNLLMELCGNYQEQRCSSDGDVLDIKFDQLPLSVYRDLVLEAASEYNSLVSQVSALDFNSIIDSTIVWNFLLQASAECGDINLDMHFRFGLLFPVSSEANVAFSVYGNPRHRKQGNLPPRLKMPDALKKEVYTYMLLVHISQALDKFPFNSYEEKGLCFERCLRRIIREFFLRIRIDEIRRILSTAAS